MNRAFHKVAFTAVPDESTIVISTSPLFRATLFARAPFANSMKCLSGLNVSSNFLNLDKISNNMSSCTAIN